MDSCQKEKVRRQIADGPLRDNFAECSLSFTRLSLAGVAREDSVMMVGVEKHWN